MTPTMNNPWRADVAPYATPDRGRALLDLATSVVPYLLLWPVMVWALNDVSFWLTLALAVPASVFLLRSFIVFHDCGHGSFFEAKAANTWLGRFTGLLVMTPYASWRHSHAVHHATAGDLDRRGEGDVPTMTVAEFNAASRGTRIGYRIFRSPFVLFTLGPLWSFTIQPRLWNRSMSRRIRHSVWMTNVAVAIAVTGMCLLVGWQQFLIIQGLLILFAGGAGVWLFFVQHQFEDTYWESSDTWTYADAALRGSSYLKLPQPLQWCSGNIGLHHVHHLSARVPNYKLQAAHDGLDVFQQVPVLTVWDALKAPRLKLWDEQRGRIVTFREARRPAAEPLAA
ncbi:fatty acid desaturase [Conexibacter sp. JD483]|uniref:fatty acid desaturase n=1 Tax=unclassified Conexibacter TaxID=2627773 RepID=UPI002717DE48|nr:MULTISPECIES: fatty acid desaturase [unclassified Conexibacter]MDO8184619.1 fatty acid desaturase [Conexibacter sp. CPCC 205706]MDO8197925.1 fatty acid desaturase [Conexibacter sp. CPCC 205762]MDR9370110.1 fatty acid desaturase [Conexibacter sp. JD483]